MYNILLTQVHEFFGNLLYSILGRFFYWPLCYSFVCSFRVFSTGFFVLKMASDIYFEQKQILPIYEFLEAVDVCFVLLCDQNSDFLPKWITIWTWPIHFGRDHFIMVVTKSLWSSPNQFGQTKTILDQPKLFLSHRRTRHYISFFASASN